MADINKKVTINKKWDWYNPRRHGRPWAARITAFDGAPTLDFIARAYNGDETGGEIVITADVGEIVKIGQKDHRGSTTINDFYRVTQGGLERIANAADARQAWVVWQGNR